MKFSRSLQSNSKVNHEGQKEGIIRQPQEFFEEAKAYEDEESNIKEDFEWFSNMRSLFQRRRYKK